MKKWIRRSIGVPKPEEAAEQIRAMSKRMDGHREQIFELGKRVAACEDAAASARAAEAAVRRLEERLTRWTVPPSADRLAGFERELLAMSKTVAEAVRWYERMGSPPVADADGSKSSARAGEEAEERAVYFAGTRAKKKTTKKKASRRTRP